MEGADRKAKGTSDLGVRTASAVVMIAVAGGALWLGGIWWDCFVFLIALVCLVEFWNLIRKATSSLAFLIGGALAAILYVGLAAMTLSNVPDGIIYHGTNPQGGTLIGAGLLISVVGFVVCTDVGAYFAGRAIGGPKIAPKISPSKTWAGLFGGMTASGLWGLFALWLPSVMTGDSYEKNSLWPYSIAAVVSGALMAILAQSGDFFESWLKRKAGVKDSSNLIPGHGGVFDRIDGLLPVVIVYGLFGDWLIVGDWLKL